MDGVHKQPHTIRGTERFATSRSQGSEAEPVAADAFHRSAVGRSP